MKYLFIYCFAYKNFWKNIIYPIIPMVIVWFGLSFIKFKPTVYISDIFSDFIIVQISAVAIMLSFSFAIISILASSDSPNIKYLRKTSIKEDEEDGPCYYYKRCKENIFSRCNGDKCNKSIPKCNKPIILNKFQIVLSTIFYNIVMKIFYILFLILCMFLQLYINDVFYKILMSISVFFLIHILFILLECIKQMYFNFWKYHEEDKENN